MRDRIKPYLQLVRLPNLFTAAADSFAGFLLVGGDPLLAGKWLPLIATSVALYAAGIVLNDLVDFQIDLRDRPSRPLPAGRVKLRVARYLFAVCLGLGVALPLLLSSPRSQLAATLLALSILVYNLGAKRSPLAAWSMGTCRALNLLLGLSLADQFGGPIAWSAAAAYGLFVAGVTFISRDETESGRARGVAIGLAIQDIAMLGVLLLILCYQAFPGSGQSLGPIPVEGLLVLAVVALIVNRAGANALFDPTPATIQRAVKTGVFSLIWLLVALVAAVRGAGPALGVAAFWIPAFTLGKWVYST